MSFWKWLKEKLKKKERDPLFEAKKHAILSLCYWSEIPKEQQNEFTVILENSEHYVLLSRKNTLS